MKSAFETYFESLKGKRIAVFGLGVSNRPLVRLLLEFGCDVTGCDREKLEALMNEDNGNGIWLNVDEAMEYGFITEAIKANKEIRTLTEKELRALAKMGY